MKMNLKVLNRLFLMKIVLVCIIFNKCLSNIVLNSGQTQLVPQFQQQPQTVNPNYPNFMQAIASIFSNLSMNQQMGYQPVFGSNYGVPPSVIYPTPYARSLELQNSENKEEKSESAENKKEEEYSGNKNQDTKVIDERKKFINFLVEFLKNSRKHTFKTYIRLKLFFKNFLQNLETTRQINHQEYLYLINLEKYILLNNYHNKVMNSKNIKSHFIIIINGESNETIFNLFNNHSFVPRNDYFQYLETHDPEYQTEIGNPLSKKDSENFGSKYANLMKYLHLEDQWHSDLEGAYENKSSKIRKRELKRQITDGQNKIRDICKELNDFLKLNKLKKFSKDETKKLKVIKYLLRLIHEHKLGSFYITLSSFYYDMGFGTKKKLKKRHKVAIARKVERMRHELSPLSFYISVFRIIHQYNYLIPSILSDLSHKDDIGKKISKISKDPRERAILKSYFDTFVERIQEISFFLFDEKYKNYFDFDGAKIVKAVLSPSSLEEFIQFNANVDLFFVQIGKIEVHFHHNRNLQNFSQMRQKYFGFFEVIILPMLESEPNFDLEKIKKKDRKFFDEVNHLKTYQKTINKHLKSNKIADVSENDFEKDQGENVFGDSVDKYLNTKTTDDVNDDMVQDFFKGNNVKPRNRHEGSEISSQVDHSEIVEIEQFENELNQKDQDDDSENPKVIKPGHRKKISSEETSNLDSENESNSETQNIIKPGHRKKMSSEENSQTDNENESNSETQNIIKAGHRKKTSYEKNSQTNNENESNFSQYANNKYNQIKNKNKNSQTQSNSSENMISSKMEKDNDSDQNSTLIDLNEFTTSDGKESSTEEIDLKKATSNEQSKFELLDTEHEESNNENISSKVSSTEKNTKISENISEENSSSENQEENKSSFINPALKKIPVKIHKNTIINEVWKNGGFKPLKHKYTGKSFQDSQNEVDHLILTMDKLKKVKIDKMIVLKSKIISELFTNFFSELDEKNTLVMLNDAQSLNRNGLIRKEVGQKLNYLLMITVEGRLFRKKIVENIYFSQIIDTWKIFMLRFSSSCQLKLYIEMMRRLQGVDRDEYIRIWKNFIKFLHNHRQYEFITCPKLILNIWMDKSILPGRVKTAKQIESIFTKTFFKFNKKKEQKALKKKKFLVKKILDKIQMKSSHDPIFTQTSKIALLENFKPGNKLTVESPDILSAKYNRTPNQSIHSKLKTDIPHYSKTKIYGIFDPGNKIGDDDIPEIPDYNYSSEFRNIFKKKTMSEILNGHLDKIKLKTNKNIDNDTIDFTKALVVGTLLDGKNGEPSLNSLAKISFNLKKKDVNYIKKLELEYRNVDNIRIAKDHNNIFTSLRKIFFKHHPHESEDKSEPSTHSEDSDPSEKIKRKKIYKKYKRRKKKGCLTRIFKKCKCEGTGQGTGNGTGCCSDNVGDDSVYNYRPEYDFRFEFDNEEEMGQFEEFLRSTEAIDKLLSSNMIDVAKAQKEFEKAQISKHFDITVNGKKIKPDDLLVPKPQNQNNNPNEDSSHPNEHSSNPNEHSSNPNEDSSHPNEDSSDPNEDNKDLEKKKIGLENLEQEIPIKKPFNKDQFEVDMNNIDLDVRNQPSVEDSIIQDEIPVDENGNPIVLNPEDVESLRKKSEDAKNADDELEQFIEKNRPLNNENDSENSSMNSSEKHDDIDVESAIIDDLDAHTKKNPKDPHLKNFDEVAPLDNVQKNLQDPLDFEEVEEDTLNYNGSDPKNKNPSLSDPLDNVYSNKLVDQVENELENKEPMRNYNFGKKDWNTDQVYTNDIKDEGIYGANINKYPELSEAMKQRLNKEILENGGYPDQKNKVEIPAKMKYLPFQINDIGDVHWAPQAFEKSLI